MKKMSLAIGTAAVVVLAALHAPAQAQPRHLAHGSHVVVVPAPPRPVVRPHPVPRHVYGPAYRHHHRAYHRHAWRDSDHDGVPNRYDRRPHNPYRR
jgi:hypothetical protein